MTPPCISPDTRPLSNKHVVQQAWEKGVDWFWSLSTLRNERWCVRRQVHIGRLRREREGGVGDLERVGNPPRRHSTVKACCLLVRGGHEHSARRVQRPSRPVVRLKETKKNKKTCIYNSGGFRKGGWGGHAETYWAAERRHINRHIPFPTLE